MKLHDDIKPDVKPYEVKDDVKPGAKPVVFEVDVHEQFTTKQVFSAREYMLQWVRIEAGKLEFGIVIGRSDNGANRRQAFATMRCERSGTYVPPIWKLKRDDTGSRKCECPFKFRGYCKVNGTWKFNVVSRTHNHGLCSKLVGHPIVCPLRSEEEKIVSNMTLNIVAPKNIFAMLKRKRSKSVSNIKQLYNLCAKNNKAERGSRSEMQHLLKLLDDDHYISRYKVCADGFTVRDIFWMMTNKFLDNDH